MPNVRSGESQSEFVGRCIPILIDEGKKKDQAVAICNSIYRESKKKKEIDYTSRFSYKSIMEIKEELDDIVVKGYIATTHFDGQDIIEKETLEKWAAEINNGNPRSNKVSVHHDRVPHVAGVGIKGTARVDKFPDGEYGLYVESLINKTREDYDDIKYQVDNGILDSFSIEYIAPKEPQFDGDARILDTDTELFGWTLASQPMNEHAVMVKELFTKVKEVDTMTEQEVKETVPIEEVKVETKEEPKVEEQKVEVKEEPKLPEDWNEYLKYKENKENEALEAKEMDKIQELKETLSKELVEEIHKETAKIESKVMVNKVNIESKELVEFKEMLEGKRNYSKDSMVKVSGDIAFKSGLILPSGRPVFKGVDVETKAIKGNLGFKTYTSEDKNGCQKQMFEIKSLGVTTNQNTDTDYLLSAAELSDVFDPVIRNMLNQATVTWNLLAKDDFSMKGNDQVQFTAKVGINSSLDQTSLGFYTGNAINTGNVSRLNYKTQFKQQAVGVEVDGRMIAAARGGPVGDVFAKEVMDSTEDLLAYANKALFAEAGAETDVGVIGFEYICDGAGNATLYNMTRSTANKLLVDTATQSYINGSSADISLSNLRTAILQPILEGAQLGNLVFITHPIQVNKFKGIYDSIQRTVPTSSRFGFEGRPDFDGVPIFADKDCNTDDWFLVDLETHRIAMWVPPTLEMLGKDADSQKGFIKMYWATYNLAPRRMVMIYGNSTS